MYKPLGGLCVATLLFICGATGFPLLPDNIPPSSGAITVRVNGAARSSVSERATLTVSGSGFAPGTPLTIGIYSSPHQLANVRSTDAGDITTGVTLPAGMTGAHTLVLAGNAPDGSGRVLTAPLTIVAAANAGQLARTGLRTASMTLAGVLLLVFGFALVRGAGSDRRLLPDRTTARHFAGRQAHGALDR